MYNIRTRDQLEIDLVIKYQGKLHLFEIKSSMTINPKHAQSLKKLKHELGERIDTTTIISNTTENFHVQKDIFNFNWKNLLIL